MRFWVSIPIAAAALLVFELPQITLGDVSAALLACAVFALAASRSAASGPALVTAIAGFYLVTSSLTNITEGVLFNVITPAAAPVTILRSLAAGLSAAIVLAAVSGRLGADEKAPASFALPIRTVTGLLWRLGAACGLFIVCYFSAGLIIFPFVKQYYNARSIPGVGAMASMAVLRSLAILASAYPLLTTLPSRRDAVLVVSIAVPVFGAIIPLLPANELMPAQVRFVHALETAPYFTMFGFLIAVLFGAPRRRNLSAHPVD